MTKYYFSFWKSPIGKLFLFADEKNLKALVFADDKDQSQIEECIKNCQPIHKKNSVINLAIKELSAYFKGQLTQFKVPVSPEGTDFQKKAWNALQRIPYGKVISYSEQAIRLKKPAAMRAVGQANGRNPIPIIIPCHRVIAKDKTIGGYSGGLVIKEKLLAIEKSL